MIIFFDDECIKNIFAAILRSIFSIQWVICDERAVGKEISAQAVLIDEGECIEGQKDVAKSWIYEALISYALQLGYQRPLLCILIQSHKKYCAIYTPHNDHQSLIWQEHDTMDGLWKDKFIIGCILFTAI